MRDQWKKIHFLEGNDQVFTENEKELTRQEDRREASETEAQENVGIQLLRTAGGRVVKKTIFTKDCLYY